MTADPLSCYEFPLNVHTFPTKSPHHLGTRWSTGNSVFLSHVFIYIEPAAILFMMSIFQSACDFVRKAMLSQNVPEINQTLPQDVKH